MTADVICLNPEAMMYDHAMEQTRLGGELFCNTHPEDAAPIDANGNVLLCLLDVGHDGPCGHAFITVEI